MNRYRVDFVENKEHKVVDSSHFLGPNAEKDAYAFVERFNFHINDLKDKADFYLIALDPVLEEPIYEDIPLYKNTYTV